VIGRDPIQVVTRRPALLGQIVGHPLVERRLPDGHGHDPLAGRREAHERLDDLEDVVDRARARERRPPELEALAIHVGVAVDEPGHREAAAEIDPAGVRSDETRDLVVRAQRGDAVAANGERPNGTGPRIDANDCCDQK